MTTNAGLKSDSVAALQSDDASTLALRRPDGPRRKEDPDHRMDPEEAKQIAKCIVEALTDAGLQIVPITKE